MKKFNWDEFKNKDNKIAVNCKTEEEAVDFCKQMHEQGMKWRGEYSYLDYTNYYIYAESTCYTAEGKYCHENYYKKGDTQSWNGVITCRKNLQKRI